MGLFTFILVGLVVGFGLRASVPGRRLVDVAMFGMGGSFVGALVGALYYGQRVFDLHSDRILAGILVTFTVLFVIGVRARGRRRVPF